MELSQLEPLVRLLGPFSATVLIAVYWITQALRERRKNGNGNPGTLEHGVQEIKETLAKVELAQDKSYLALLGLHTAVSAGVKRLEDVWAELQRIEPRR